VAEKDLCAVIPAAGRGSRLGLDVPKLLAPLSDDATVWTHLRDSLIPCADRIHVVVSPASRDAIQSVIAAGSDPGRISLGVQPQPLGMGDAIFGAFDAWRNFARLLVVWGDQAGLSIETLRRLIALHESGRGPRCTLPVVELEQPYVQYVFRDRALTEIRQRREGAAVDELGFSDVGVFLLETDGLLEAWFQYLEVAAAGLVTGEVNFLPFLVYLSQRARWTFDTVLVADPVEARGINTPDDLRFFQERFVTRRSQRS
jgi:bifunctional UDP-N-acetylglucosamine pyrophosphorylase/glucosamine-1-phosphate N-acetyltransferase